MYISLEIIIIHACPLLITLFELEPFLFPSNKKRLQNWSGLECIVINAWFSILNWWGSMWCISRSRTITCHHILIYMVKCRVRSVVMRCSDGCRPARSETFWLFWVAKFDGRLLEIIRLWFILKSLGMYQSPFLFFNSSSINIPYT
jgi:hypothetical protein